jgi:hypothetical protein
MLFILFLPRDFYDLTHMIFSLLYYTLKNFRISGAYPESKAARPVLMSQFLATSMFPPNRLFANPFRPIIAISLRLAGLNLAARALPPIEAN